MQKEIQLNNVNNHEWVKEERTFSSRQDAAAFIENFISSKKEKPHYAEVVLPTNELLRLFGYKSVSTIRAPDFIVHITDKKYERGFNPSLAKDICMVGGDILKKERKSWFDEKLIDELLTNPENLVRLSDKKFEGLVTVFSTLNSKAMTPVPIDSQSIRVRQLTDDLTVSARYYYDQLKAIVLLMELEDEGLSSNDAVKNVLQNIPTGNFVSACEEYGFTVEQGFASSILAKEQYAKNPLLSFIFKLENINNPSRVAGELRVDVEQIGRVVKFQERLNGLKTEGEHLQNKLAAELGGDPRTAKKDEQVSAVIRFNNRVAKLEKEVRRNGLGEDYDNQLGKLEESAKQMGLTLQPTENPDKVKKKPLKVGAELCELQLQRSIAKYSANIAEDETRIKSAEISKQSQEVKGDEVRAEELQKNIILDTKSMEDAKEKRLSLKKTLKIVQEMVVFNEPTKS